MSLFEMLLPLLVPPVDVLIKTLPPATVLLEVEEPRTLQLVIKLLCAPLIRRTVLVPAVADVLALEIVNELPAELMPLMVTLSAPLRSTSGVARLPLTVLAPLGVMVRLVHELTE